MRSTWLRGIDQNAQRAATSSTGEGPSLTTTYSRRGKDLRNGGTSFTTEAHDLQTKVQANKLSNEVMGKKVNCAIASSWMKQVCCDPFSFSSRPGHAMTEDLSQW